MDGRLEGWPVRLVVCLAANKGRPRVSTQGGTLTVSQMIPPLTRCQVAPISAVTPRMDPDKPKYASVSLTKEKTDADNNCLYHALARLAHYHKHPLASQYYDPATDRVDVSGLRNDIAYILQRDYSKYKSRHEVLAPRSIRAKDDSPAEIDRERVAADKLKKKYLSGVRASEWAGEPELDAAAELFRPIKIVAWTDYRKSLALHTIVESDYKDGARAPPQVTKWQLHVDNGSTHYSWMHQDKSAAELLANPTATPTAKRSAPAQSRNAATRDAEMARRERRSPLSVDALALSLSHL